MANIKITDLTAETNPASTDVLPIVDVAADETKKLTIADLLENAGPGSAGNAAFAFDGDSDTGLFRAGDNALGFTTGGSEASRLDSDGRLLVGTSTSPSGGDASAENARLIVSGRVGNDSDSGRLNLQRGSSVSFPNQQLGLISFTDSSNNAYASIAVHADSTTGTDDYPGRLVFSVTADGSASPTEAMRINNGAELLVGYTSDNGAYKLQVNSAIFATSATIATSDGRYKENVATLSGCVDLIKAFRPVSFDWKSQQDITRIDDEGNEVLVREGHNFPDGTQVGFIAQEIQSVLSDRPWLGSVIKQNVRPAVTDADGNELAPEEEFFGIAEGNLVPVLTSALKDALNEIDSLKARVDALESN